MKLKIFLLASVAVLFACKADKNEQQESPIAIAASVYEPMQMKSIITGTSFAEGDKVGVYVAPWMSSSSAGTLRPSGNYKDNLEYTATATAEFTPPIGAVYPNSSTKVDIYAYSPFVAAGATIDANGKFGFNVNADQTVAENYIASDFMTAFAEGKAAGSTVTAVDLTFTHRLSQVTLVITVPSKFKGDAISGVESVTIKNVLTQGIFAPKDATSDVTSVVGDVKMYNGADVEGNKTFSAIVMPSAASVDAQMDIILVGSGANRYKFNYTTSGKFVAGQNRTFNITTFEDERVVALGNGTITAWSATSTNGGAIVEQGATEAFYVATGAPATTNKVKVTCDDGYTYELTAKITSERLDFKFTGEFGKSPEKYPYKVTGLEYYNGATKVGGGVLKTPVSVTSKQVAALPIVNVFN